MELSKAVGKQAQDLEVVYGGEVLKFKYNPNVMTPKFIKELKTTDTDDVDALGRFVAKTVLEWDLVDNGTPLPIDEETCAKLPIALLNEIVVKCNEALSPTGKSGRQSRTSATGSAAGVVRGVRQEDQLTLS